MGWFRIDDRADDNPKLLSLSDGAFRLWIMGGIHCAKHKTDGILLRVAVEGLRLHRLGATRAVHGEILPAYAPALRRGRLQVALRASARQAAASS